MLSTLGAHPKIGMEVTNSMLKKLKHALDSAFGIKTRPLSSMASSALKEEVDAFSIKDEKSNESFPLPPTPALFNTMIHQKMNYFINENMKIGNDRDANVMSQVSKYYFDGNGKTIRPTLAYFMSQAVNGRLGIGADQRGVETLLEKQNDLGLIAEMMHTASLYHDDVLDAANLRRGRESINRKFGEVAAVHAGGYSCGLANWTLAKIGDEDVMAIMASVMAALVDGELQQAAKSKHEIANGDSNIISDSDVDIFLGSPSGDEHAKMLCRKYLLKSYNKTASLMANSCKAVAALAVKSRGESRDNDALVDAAFGLGRDIGICFQMVDDALDFEADQNDIGKPVGADLKSGLVTAPLILSLRDSAELKILTSRNLCFSGDSERALEIIQRSRGPTLTRMAADRFAHRAKKRLEDMGMLTEALKGMLDTAAGRVF